jgi:magnesium-transporting ATPase (P-type)
MFQVEIFQEYNDTVVSVGLSHLTRNEDIFSSADVAVGIDILAECEGRARSEGSPGGHVFTSELEFVQSISAHSCAFRFRGASSVSHISTIIETSRASLDAAVAAAIYLITGCLSLSLYVVFSVCAPSTAMPFVPTLGCAIYLLALLPGVGLCMAMSDGDKDTMKRVPPKNDRAITFARNERSMFYFIVVSKALLPALLPQVLHLIAFGELMLRFEPNLVATNCPLADNWVDIVRCNGLEDYSGSSKTSAGSLVFAQFVLCVIVSSAGFVHRFLPLKEQKPWERNFAWLCSVFIAFGLLVLYVAFATEEGTAEALPWYFYLISSTSPFLCLMWVEMCKLPETKQERRAEKLRRLQFETRLGAWSPR